MIARTSHDPALLKPSPHLIIQAVEALDAEPGECTLVGDSVTDVQAARLASVQSIGYANEPGIPERLAAAGAASQAGAAAVSAKYSYDASPRPAVGTRIR